MQKHILLVEDEKNIARFIELELKHEQFGVTVCSNGRIGLETALEQEFDVILLDVMLPELNGIEVCRRIRAISDVPIILITARDAVIDRVAGLDAGADDYIVKPFAIEELLARIRSILRRYTSIESTGQQLVFKNITIDSPAYTAYVNEEILSLTKTEFDLLSLLIENKNRVCTRDQILEQVWGYQSDVETNVVDVYIRHLRSKLPKLESGYIETVRGVGYVMRE
ncbi:response regulator transcription factor [Viridibacillus sp. FSL R5-0477]|uniref:Response regulator ArlR n=1 Tax=Viridibacillus arenosi FSL R5-213 TaxID=1227360 RepID=W4EJZ8_9BACL|nr:MULTISPECIES: response regulator transcription factor [Viridibacillus]ETT80885.1 response regulator ArlR [Viridibacillus arenosi FSL R5-213]OMC78386.1 DNA-binding response regulator [Viridibacillus sp. FSL H8-0123]OMC81876.1 DNA-binding response regulator [Viridibacillus sp. FSL H7-0596]OMC93009.1 DNA-binding response regulator [Viridibacillus arenosi]